MLAGDAQPVGTHSGPLTAPAGGSNHDHREGTSPVSVQTNARHQLERSMTCANRCWKIEVRLVVRGVDFTRHTIVR